MSIEKNTYNLIENKSLNQKENGDITKTIEYEER